MTSSPFDSRALVRFGQVTARSAERAGTPWHCVIHFDGARSHYAASFLRDAGTPAGPAAKHDGALFVAQIFLRRGLNFFRVTARNPSRMVFTSCGSPSNKVKHASKMHQAVARHVRRGRLRAWRNSRSAISL